MKAGAQGGPIWFVSGDQGVCGLEGRGFLSKHLHPDFPAASQYITAAGGTDLVAPGTIGNETTRSAGGGDFSDSFAIPSWQADMHWSGNVSVLDVRGNKIGMLTAALLGSSPMASHFSFSNLSELRFGSSDFFVEVEASQGLLNLQSLDAFNGRTSGTFVSDLHLEAFHDVCCSPVAVIAGHMTFLSCQVSSRQADFDCAYSEFTGYMDSDGASGDALPQLSEVSNPLFRMPKSVRQSRESSVDSGCSYWSFHQYWSSF
jgi:hypothetical protein